MTPDLRRPEGGSECWPPPTMMLWVLYLILTLIFLVILSFHFWAMEPSIRSNLEARTLVFPRADSDIYKKSPSHHAALPGPLLILIAHDEILFPNGQRRTQAGGRVVEGVCFFWNVDQRRLEHLLHVDNSCGLQTAVSHLPHPRPDHCRRIDSSISSF